MCSMLSERCFGNSDQVGRVACPVQKFDTPLVEPLRRRLRPLKLIAWACKTMIGTGPVAAIPFFKHAIELDPNFALAYAYLGSVMSDNGEPSIGADLLPKSLRTTRPDD